ncbi:hypothetical protein [Longispora urticae]
MTVEATTGAGLAGHLELLGLDPAECAAYERLLLARDTGPRDPGAPDAPALHSLVELGLATVDPLSGDRLVAVPPDVGLEILAGRRQAAIHRARSTVLAAYEEFRRSRHSHPADGVVEEVAGEAIRQRIRQVERSATAEIRRFDTPPYFFPDVANTVELDQLATGIRYRVVYAAGSLARPGYLDGNIAPCVAAGEQARQAPGLPVKLTLVDDRLALLSPSVRAAESSPVLLMVRPSGLLSALAGLFELTWRTAAPLYPAATSPDTCGPPPAERRLLALLAAGATDEHVIRDLGLSRRTFYRRLGALMTRAGAANRVQLAMYARRAGWL